MNKTVSISIILALIMIIGAIFWGGSRNNTNTTTSEAVQNSEIKDGIQYITVSARGGYMPKVSMAKAGIPTKLILKTNGTYDCSASLVIRSIGFQKILPQTGETEIDLGVPKVGEPVRGVCGMGMYSFLINFS